jgi:hypothetical protein
MLWPQESITNKLWETKTIVRFGIANGSERSSFSTSQSNAEVSSSKKITLGVLIKALAMDNLCFCPPEKLLGQVISNPGF